MGIIIPIDTSKPFRHKEEGSPITYLFRIPSIDEEDRYTAIAEMAKQARAKSQESYSYNIYCKALIDFFLIGWEGCQEPFPEHGSPSAKLRNTDIYAMASLIHKILPELIGGGFETADKQ